MPPLRVVVLDLELKGGDLKAFLQDNADTVKERKLLLFTIYQKLSEQCNAPHAVSWSNALTCYLQSTMAMAEAEALAALLPNEEDAPPSNGRRKSSPNESIIKHLLSGKGSRGLVAVPTPVDAPPQQPPTETQPPALEDLSRLSTDELLERVMA